MADIILSRNQYDSLLSAAAGNTSINVLQLREAIDTANDIRRYFLRIRWLETGAPTPSTTSFENWPPAQEFRLELERAIARADVDTVLDQQAIKPAGVMVTTSRVLNLGFTLLEDYDFDI